MSDKGIITLDILSDIADAIRDKYGFDDTLIKPKEMADYILNLETIEKNYRYHSSWRGLITPVNGAYIQGFYNNGVAIDDKIYFPRDAKKAHWNGENLPDQSLFYCYDTTNNTLTCKIPYYNGERFHINGMWYDGTAIYGFGLPYRYKTTDFGDTWTREEMTSVGLYQPTPIFQLKNGRLIGTMLNRTEYLMISDDNGITWSTVSPFTNEQFDGAWYTMSHGTICELDDCVVLYFNTPIAVYGAGVKNNDSQRYVSVSYDNGDTWSAPKKCTGDLGIAGYGISPGGFGYLGNKYHFIVGRRYRSKVYDADDDYIIIGDLCWYIGDADDVKNGTMELRKVLTRTLVPKIRDDPQISPEDTGNSGVCLCNGNLYANYGNIIYNHDDPDRGYCSNQGLEIFRITVSDREPDVAPYWDANFKDKFNQILDDESTEYDYYFYSPNNTNINYNWFGYSDRGYIPDVGKFAIPLGSDFEINVIYQYGIIRPSDNVPKILSGIELVSDNSLHALGGINYDASSQVFDASIGSITAGTLPRSAPTYITYKKQNGVISITVNGITITDPVFDWTKEKSSVWQNIESDSYVYNINATDAEVQAYIQSNPKSFNMSGLMMLTITCGQSRKNIYMAQTDNTLDISSSGTGESTSVLITRKTAVIVIE